MRILYKRSVFIGIEILLYGSFLFLDIYSILMDGTEKTELLSGILKYTSVIVCLIYGLGRKEMLLQWAQIFVVTADYFLLFTAHNTVGVLLFVCVQHCYSRYLTKEAVKIKRMIREKQELVLCMLGFPVAIYAGFLLSNACRAAGREFRKEKANRYFAVGLWLLVLCDIHVAFHNVPRFPEGILAVWQTCASVFMWLFYLPSQVLIALAAVEKSGLKSEKIP